MEKGKPSQHSILYNEIFLSQETGPSHKVAVLFYLSILADNLAKAIGKWWVGGEVRQPRKFSSERICKVLLGWTANLIILGPWAD